MPPTIRTGALGTQGTMGINQDQRVVDMMDRVFQYDPPGSPMMNIVTKKAQVKKASSTEVKHLEDDIITEWDVTTQSRVAGDGTVTVGYPDIYRVGSIVKVVETGETMRVTNVNVGTSTLTVARSWGATAAGSISNGARLLHMGAAEMEGDLAPAAKATVTVTKSNYTQIFKNAVHITKTADTEATYGGNERMRQRNKAGARHAQDIEQVLLHGEKNLDTGTGTYPIRSAGGLDEHISTNVLAANGPLLESEFHEFVGECFRYTVRPGRSRKLLLCSRAMLGTIAGWSLSKLTTNVGLSQKYGVSISTYLSPYGTLDIINHPLLEQGYAGSFYILDPDGIWYRPYRPTRLETNIQEQGEDAWKDQYLTECSFTFAQEKCFGKGYGVTA